MAVGESTNPIDRVVTELCNKKSCRDAITRYQTLVTKVGRDVLKQGSTDFDRSFRNENSMFKVFAYVGCYMEMHYEANKAVFAKCVFLAKTPVIFIDFGCGPMTSGLALLAYQNKMQVGNSIAYLGVDMSRNMRKVARAINNDYGLFKCAYFCADFNDAVVDSEKLLDACREAAVVINFSYSLSSKTLKPTANKIDVIGAGVGKLIEYGAGTDACPLYLIYQNPKDKVGIGGFVKNWRGLVRNISSSCRVECEMTESVDYPSGANPVDFKLARVYRK